MTMELQILSYQVPLYVWAPLLCVAGGLTGWLVWALSGAAARGILRHFDAAAYESELSAQDPAGTVAEAARRPDPDATITDAELCRLIHDACWAADIEVIMAESDAIDEWLAAGCPADSEPWALARLT